MQPTAITPQATLADLAVHHPGASRVFHRHGLDFCCGGRVPLAEACQVADLDAHALVSELECEERAADDRFHRWDEAPLGSLIDHILVRYHESHRAEVPRLLQMARKVEEVHGEKPACPRGLAAHLERVAEEMELHMQKEEQVLFPLIQNGQGRHAAMPVQVMEEEHRDHGANLAKLRELAHDFEPPEEACTTWRALYLGLAQLEEDLMHHIHLENNVLFPRALRG